MTCAQCGNQEAAGVRFCGRCGAPMAGGPPLGSRPPRNNSQMAPGAAAGKSFTQNPTAIAAVLGVVAVVIVVAALVLAGVGGDDKKKEDPNASRAGGSGAGGGLPTQVVVNPGATATPLAIAVPTPAPLPQPTATPVPPQPEPQPVARQTVAAPASETAAPEAATEWRVEPEAAPEPAPAPPAEPETAMPQASQTPRSSDRGNGTSVEDLRRSKSSPLVRKIASEHNIDISRLEGTGLSGRVTKNDILSFIESGGAAPKPAAAPKPPTVAAASAPAAVASTPPAPVKAITAGRSRSAATGRSTSRLEITFRAARHNR